MPLDHALGGKNFRLPDRRGRLNVDNDRILHIDQIVRGIGEESLSTMGAGPACRPIPDVSRQLCNRPHHLPCGLSRCS
jgi:hypothetical protein